ncbi:MAG: transcription factor FapR [Bacillota bacterium]
MGRNARDRRHEQLQNCLAENPFLTDEELAGRLGVSIQTIRLDRMRLSIPELRMRTRAVAQRTLSKVKALGSREIVGELVDIVLGRSALSILETTGEMAFERTKIVRGHYIFAQAESMAIALIDAEVALTGLANVKYKRPVQVGEKLVAKAEVIRIRGTRSVVQVVTRVEQEQVFRAKFVVFAVGADRGGEASADSP